MLSDAHAPMDAITVMVHPLDRGWMRDISPCFVHTGKRARAAIRFKFNGWAKYDNHRLDAAWPETCAPLRNLPLIKAVHDGNGVVLEGGAIDGNGQGCLITTEECLLDQNTQLRNPGFNKQDYEACFSRYLGIKQVIWLNKGIAGDDTHGHVDDICRFVNASTVAACRESNPNDCNYGPLEDNLERLQGTRLHTGEKLEVVHLPMPAPLYFRGVRLPASYANFYIANQCVLAPTFNDANDRIALGVLGELFPDRPVIGIHAVDLVWGFGTLHCLSHEEPAHTKQKRIPAALTH